MAETQPKRTIGAKKIGPKSGAAGPAKREPPAPEPEPPKKNKKKPLFLAAAALVLAGGGYVAYSSVLAPDDAVASVEQEHAAPELGAVVPLEDPISVNLADGRYLRLGYALQLPLSEEGDAGHGGDEAGGPDVSRTRDIAITTFSGRAVEDVNNPEQREAMRAEFLATLQEAFGAEEVLDVYFTDFVTQ